jgi:purine-nucleoside phosphorylase
MSETNMTQMLNEATEFVSGKVKDFKPEIGLILGSGLGFFADYLQDAQKISYADIPYFAKSTVVGHQGQLVLGNLHNKKIVAMQGRMHFYEGYKMKQVTFPVRLMKRLGVHTLIVTNAAGGVKDSFNAGDLMLITDHINFMGTNPCIGPKEEDAKHRFFDMTTAYDPKYREISKKVAQELDIELKEGVYFAETGPSYETPAEIRMIRTLGGDAVGMSTVPEVITARELDIRVCGISCITNLAAGVSPTKLSHEEVTETANRVKPIFVKLIDGIIKNIN